MTPSYMAVYVCTHVMLHSVAPLRAQCPFFPFFFENEPRTRSSVCADRGLWVGHQGEAAAEERLTDSNLPSPRLDQTAASSLRMPLSTNGMQQLCGGASGWAGWNPPARPPHSSPPTSKRRAGLLKGSSTKKWARHSERLGRAAAHSK